MTDSPPADVLIATTVHWASTTRLALALADSGLRIAAVAPAQHALHRMSAIAASRVCSPHSGFAGAMTKAITTLRPAMVIPGDDRAARGLYALHDRMAGRGGRGLAIARVIRRSLGDPSSFPILARKSRFADFCAAEGLPMPETVVVHGRRQFQALLACASLPQVLKLDGRWGGRGVHVIRTIAEANDAFDHLMAWRGWRSAFRRALEELSAAPLLAKIHGDAPAISLQHFVEGGLANRAVLCREGTVLAGITVASVQLGEETGPSTVVRVIDHGGINDLTARIVRRLNLSGFIGVDLVLDAAGGRPWIIELNPRPTQVCHLAFSQESDMVSALACALRGAPARPLPRQIYGEGRVIALYPGEKWRDPGSVHLGTADHDIPWHQPEFIAAYRTPVADDPPSWVQSLARSCPIRWLRRPFAGIGGEKAVEARPIVAAPPKTAGGG